MRAASMPQLARPSFQRVATSAGSPPSTHGAKDSAAKSGKVRRRLPRSPFGSRISVGHPLEERLLDEADAEAGLAGSGHADDDAVGGEVGRLHQHPLARALVLAVDRLAQEQLACGNVSHGPGS